ncbi:zinc ribbon domain-containing protein [Candidatus Sumerlaeota bacterium]|nr:zinc ribbon domain-containing protein [Candidatus Sumerlaeota bacterium]
MPIYEYRCKECNHRFEDLIRNESEAHSVKCPKCGSKSIEKLMSSAGIQMNSSSSGGASSCPTCTTNTCSTCNL